MAPEAHAPPFTRESALSVQWSIHPTDRRVILTITDPYTIGEWQAAIMAVLEDPSFVAGFGFLVDRRKCSPPTARFVRQQLAFLASQTLLRVPHRVALLVPPNDGAAFGMARLLDIYTESETDAIEHGIFATVEDAERWLETPQAAADSSGSERERRDAAAPPLGSEGN